MKARNVTIDATVLFADLRGYTSASQYLATDQMTSTLDAFYDECAEAIWEHDGLLNKTIGDAIMAVFNFPIRQGRSRSPPEGSEATEERGMAVAESRRKHKRNYTVDKFWWTGRCPFRDRDKVMQVTEYSKGRRLIDAPADVIYTRRWRRDGREVTFVYLELPDVRRVSLEKLARRLGYGAKKGLFKNGIVRDRVFGEKLLGNWNQF